MRGACAAAAAAAAASPPAGRPAVHGCLSCCPYRKTVRVKIVDEEEYERQENFFIALGEPKWMERGISGVRSLMKKKIMIENKQIESSLQTPNPENITLFLLLPLPPFLLLLWMDGLLLSALLYSHSHPVLVSSLPFRAQLTSDPPFVRCLGLRGCIIVTGFLCLGLFLF